ncbi:hypothetical protein D3C76_1388760 [compost metagenome]
MRCRCRVAGGIANADANGAVALSQLAQIGGGDAGAPGSVRLHGSGVGFAIQRDGYQLARFYMGGGAAQRLAGFHLCAVDNIVTGKHIDAQGWQIQRIGVDRHGMGDGGGVARRIAQGGG